MVAVPAVTPDTIPVEPTTATEVLALLHVPPVQVLLRAVVEPWHIVKEPVMGGAELVGVHLYHWADAGELPIVVVNVEDDGVGDDDEFGSVL